MSEKIDRRKFNGGNKNAGRKSKSEEQRLIEKLTPMESTALKALADALKEPKTHSWSLPLYFGYMYGKPKQRVEAKIDDNREDIEKIFPIVNK